MLKKVTLIIFLCTASLHYAQVGIGTTEPKSTLDINGNLSVKVVDLNGGPQFGATPINDGVYLNLTPTANNDEFLLPDPRDFPGRIYIMRNISDTVDAKIFTQGESEGVRFFAGDSSGNSTRVTMSTTTSPTLGNQTKTLIFISDKNNWTYGILGF